MAGGSKPITLLGGLTSFGGAGNNYSMHAVIEMVRYLREGKGRKGLILANGGWVTYQHVVCLSTSPRADGSAYPTGDPLPESLESETVIPSITEHPSGRAVIETYTVEFGRNGVASQAYIIGRLVDGGARFIANEADSETLKEISDSSTEQIGKQGWVRADPDIDGRNVFSFKSPLSKL
jgi:hypothetical protein